MTSQQEIDRAIDAHTRWTAQLRDAIHHCSCSTPLEVIQSDNQCEFGRWLYSDTITPTEKAAPRFKIVQKLHAEFHRTAARVAELALAGRQADASKMLQENGEYNVISRKLINAMQDWKKIFRR